MSIVINLQKLKQLPIRDKSSSTEGLSQSLCTHAFIEYSGPEKYHWERQQIPVTRVIQAFDFSGKGEKKTRTYSATHGFIGAILTAWDSHRPLVLSPDHFWLLILHGVSRHVEQNSEKLRGSFVKFPNKKQLEVRRDSFLLDSDKNDWQGVVDDFVSQIDENTVAETVDLLTPSFSCSTKLSSIASKVSVMDICQSYFTYVVMTLCGFPSVTLQGTPEDWTNLRKQAEALFEGDKMLPDFSKRWGERLLPIIKKLEEQAQQPEKPDQQFWDSMVKRDGSGGSGGYSWLNGWFNKFVPFWNKSDGSVEENPLCFSEENEVSGAERAKRAPFYPLNETLMPKGISIVPALWNYLGTELELAFLSGFMGYVEDAESGAITPQLGWLVVRKKNEK